MPTRRFSGTATSSSVPDNGGDHSGGGSGGTYVDDVFSTYLYKGTDTSTSHHIQNGIDLAGEGGLVWVKKRDSNVSNTSHQLYDTERGASAGFLSSDSTNQQGTGDLSSFDNDGFTWNANTGLGSDYLDSDFVSWTFRKAPNFFDVVTYTGDGVAGREIPHNLGCEPGMIIVKRTDDSSNWYVQHRSTGPTKSLFLDTTSAATVRPDWNDTAPTDSVFTVGSLSGLNGLGGEYVAYLFAHDDSDESMIKCGSYTGTGSNGLEIDLGFEPQWLLIKKSVGNASAVSDWHIYDNMRGVVTGGNDSYLRANLSDAEVSGVVDNVSFTSSGFIVNANISGSNEEYVYMAIRRPNKPTEEFDPEELFAVDSLNSDGQFESGFPVDFALQRNSISGTQDNWTMARLLSGKRTKTNGNAAEGTEGNAVFDYQDRWYKGSGPQNTDNVSWMWRRAPGFFDVVCYEGDRQAGREVPHNLGVAPDMMWIKKRTDLASWEVYHSAIGATQDLLLDKDWASRIRTIWNDTEPTDSMFTIGSDGNVNSTGDDYIAYLFATVPGVSKVGSYTGNGNSQDIDCGFTNGARWVLIKCTSSTGNWWFTSNPSDFRRLCNLNSTDAESNYSSTSVIPEGFRVTSTAGNLNDNDAEYIYYAIAE